MPRSLRGVRAVSIVTGVDPGNERRHQLFGPHRDGAGVRNGVHVRGHRLKNLRPMRVDPEHVRNVPTLRAYALVQCSYFRG